jgi:hypothetical protein
MPLLRHVLWFWKRSWTRSLKKKFGLGCRQLSLPADGGKARQGYLEVLDNSATDVSVKIWEWRADPGLVFF